MKKIIIICEAGVNHNGDYNIAKKMVLAAKEAGADYIKFQTAVPELVISKQAEKAEYQKENTGVTESQLEMCRKIHLPLDDYKPLKAFCDEVGIKFLSTPFDLISIDLLSKLDMDFFKIPSGEITNLPYLRKIAGLGVPIILSTGMCELKEIEAALNILEGKGLTRESITLLHCTTEYPAPMGDVNLKAMLAMARYFGMKVGYSDHTKGIEVPIAAAALGACVIEKHFTLDKNMEGPDHKASLEPKELSAMIRAIRNIEKALGTGEKKASSSEIKNIPIARKSIIAACPIIAGELFTETNLTTKRPGTGLSPMLWDSVIGTMAKKAYEPDDLIEL
jgi:N,N'-diacetyllegionaminate synthase